MANTVYDNFVLENKMENLLSTGIDMNSYMTVDNSLTENAGMKKTIHTYTATGNVQDLAQGVGNSGDISVSFESKDYTVKTTQGRFVYFDEEAMKDPMVVDAGLKAVSEKMINDQVAKAIAEFDKANLEVKNATWSFDNFVDAIAKLNTEDESKLFCLISVADKAKIRKALKDDLKYSEDYVRTGYIGTVAGVPVIVSKAVPTGKAFLASKDAVTVFVKKGTEIEQERDANLRKNTVYARKVMLVALTDATKVVEIREGE